MELITTKLMEKFAKYPFGSQYDKGADAECIVKYFFASWAFFVTEAARTQDDLLLYGCFLDLGRNPVRLEWGYIPFGDLSSISLCGLKVERDLYADGKTVRQLCRDFGIEYEKQVLK